MTLALTETLHDQFGPYGTTVEELKTYVQSHSDKHAKNGWTLAEIEYRKEMDYQTGRYRFIAHATYTRITES